MKLARRRSLGNLRRLHAPKNLIDFASNDYLGLARSNELNMLVEKEEHESSLNGFGSTGSRLLTGNTSYAEDLEDHIASFHGYPAGLIFNCGYMANVGLLSVIANSDDTIFFDAHVHASIHDGIRLSRACAYPFRHSDLEHLESRLRQYGAKGNRYICIESVYSTAGTMAPLEDICRLANEYEARLIVDEAHAVGAFGPGGRGLVAERGLMKHVFAQVVTFGKAIGTFGAIVLGSDLLKEYLINFSNAYIYTTALPFRSLAAIKSSYDLFPTLDDERAHIRNLIFRFQSSSSSKTQIQPIKIAGNQAVRQIAEKLQHNGFDVRPLMSPTVQRGHEVLRICLHAFNTAEEVDSLLRSLERYI